VNASPGATSKRSLPRPIVRVDFPSATSGKVQQAAPARRPGSLFGQCPDHCHASQGSPRLSHQFWGRLLLPIDAFAPQMSISSHEGRDCGPVRRAPGRVRKYS
jgi:hypothetical protein